MLSAVGIVFPRRVSLQHVPVDLSDATQLPLSQVAADEKETMTGFCQESPPENSGELSSPLNEMVLEVFFIQMFLSTVLFL